MAWISCVPFSIGGEEATSAARSSIGPGIAASVSLIAVTAPSSIPAACHVWAGQVMLADLGPRYSEETLAPVRTWIKDWSDQLP